MEIYQRAFGGAADKKEMAALTGADPRRNFHITDLPYRFSSWAFDDPENVGLWVDVRGQLVAWAVMQTPFWTIDYSYRSQAEPGLHQRILDWADMRAQKLLGSQYGIPAWFVNVLADQVDQIHDLEKSGFESQANKGEDSWSKVFMERSGNQPVKQYPLPNGFLIRPLAGESEVEAYVRLHQSVFETKNMTIAWRQRTLQHPDYHPDLDLVIVAPDGELTAFCIGWLRNDLAGIPIGQIEPLGCHKDYRRYALGRIALTEVLRRLQSRGAVMINVETDIYRNTALALYESVGFRVAREITVLGKTYGSYE